jgi:hypothetical protein
MVLLRHRIRKWGLQRRWVLGVLGIIAARWLLLLDMPFVHQAVALTIKPFSGTPAPKLPTPERIVSLVDQDQARLVTMFKDIHQHPELGFMETRTAGIVAKELKALGYEETGIGKTGVVGILRNGDGPKVMYRADKGANAVVDLNAIPFGIRLDPIMTMELLGNAK